MVKFIYALACYIIVDMHLLYHSAWARLTQLCSMYTYIVYTNGLAMN